MRCFRPRLLAIMLPAFLLSAPHPSAQAAEAAVPVYRTTGISWQPQVAYDFASLRVVGPNDYLYEQDFGGAQPSFSLKNGAKNPADGHYSYELVFGRAASGDRQQAGAQGDTYSGSFLVAGGRILTPQTGEDTTSLADSTAPQEPNDVVVADDQIVQGSLCVGFDCVNGENFNFDTIRLKENNTRIKFDDTSTSTGFPANDWQLTANDSASGGLNKFSIEDVTGAKVPFTVVAGAPNNSLYIASTGRVGFRTSTPVLDLHVATGDTPALRLEQNGSSGFTAQTWDIAGNEANFFIRDVTSGSRLPFRIRPGAPTSSLDIAASGNIGVGTASPGTALHVSRTSPANTEVSLRLTNSLSSWDIKNNGATGRLTYTDDVTGARVPFKFGLNAVDNLLRVGVVNVSTVDVNGTLTVNGTFNNNSSRTQKDLLSPADIDAVLDSLSHLPLYTWSYRNENGVRHFGPVAEDFFTRFGLGTDEKHISPSDMAGIALAAAKALNTLVTEKDAEILALKERLERVEGLLNDFHASGANR